MSEVTFADSFAEIEDSQCLHNTLSPIKEIVLHAIGKVTSGANDFVALEEFGGSKLGWIQGLLPQARRIPSQETLSRMFG